MVKLHNLFQLRLLTKEENSYQFVCTIDQNHPIFSGHFPQMPVMPGVCLLHAIKNATKEVIGKTVFFCKIRECKFLSVINPQVTKEFVLEFSLSEQNEIKGAVFVDNTQCMKLKATISF